MVAYGFSEILLPFVFNNILGSLVNFLFPFFPCFAVKNRITRLISMI